ncbi:MAG: hypothetical protein OXF54_22880 [Caldilineaceae bacterium]|nr:hypothetical protein [Caldilineaceae bacterium]
MAKSSESRGLLFNGIAGGNLLGFLAAIGTLQVVANFDPSVDWRLSWKTEGGPWSPVLFGDKQFSSDSFVDELLIPALTRGDNGAIEAFTFANNLNVSPEQFRDVATAARNSAAFQSHRYADFIAAFGCESLVTPDKRIQDTALRTMSGAGHQHFLRSMKELVEKTERDHLNSSLFETWTYVDERPSLRWDPIDDRRHALRWKRPADDPVRTMRGANRLALEALPLLPTAPQERELHTTGFSQRRGAGVFFTWPIWESSLGIDVIRSLLSLADLQDTHPKRDRLRSMGIVEIFRCERITVDKFRNFTQATPV